MRVYVYWKDVQRVIARLEEIRREQGEAALPRNRKRVVAAKWRSLAKMSVLYGGFRPKYPNKLSVDGMTFCDVFPYHVAFDSSMAVVHAGTNVGGYC